MRILLIIFLFGSLGTVAQLNVVRNKQLDSVVTNIPRQKLVNIDSVHAYLHNVGQTDSERVFLYYGLIGIHYKYDQQRKKDGKRAKEYTPEYTVKRRKGVCRDFAAVFKELCDRSDIPCVLASGRAKVPVGEWMKDAILFKLKYSNHAWNIVKYDDEWHLMDPTWTQVRAVEKYYELDENGRRKFKTKAKRPTRNYYDPTSENFHELRRSEHPAFYISNTVYSFKSARKNIKRRTIIDSNYQFSPILDSLASNPYYQYSKEFKDASFSYSKKYSIMHRVQYEFKYLDLKRTNENALTVDGCNAHLVELKELLDYIKVEHGWDMKYKYKAHRTDVILRKARIERRANMER